MSMIDLNLDLSLLIQLWHRFHYNSPMIFPWDEISCDTVSTDTQSVCPVLGNWAHRYRSTNTNLEYNPHIECITPPIYDYQGYFKIHNGFELAAEVTWEEKFHSSLDYCFNWCKTKMKCAIVKEGLNY